VYSFRVTTICLQQFRGLIIPNSQRYRHSQRPPHRNQQGCEF